MIAGRDRRLTCHYCSSDMQGAQLELELIASSVRPIVGTRRDALGREDTGHVRRTLIRCDDVQGKLEAGGVVRPLGG